MGQLPELQQARVRLGLALDPICHDRWVLGFLRDGSLQPLAASEITRRFHQARPLMPLSRRALFEKRPLVINSLVEHPNPSNGYDWELDWPAILYAPVFAMGQRPTGLLVVGCRRDHWYTEEDVAYAHSLGLTLAPLVDALRGPFSKLSELEGEVAQLLSHGLSSAEIASAVRTDERHARTLVDGVARKLRHLESANLVFPLVPVRRRAYRL